MKIPFNHPYSTGKELDYIREAMAIGHLSGNGEFTHRCQQWLEESIGCQKALLTPSGTAALEMAAVLLDLKPGDEVIMPSFTFVSTANAFVLQGAVPVFVDIREDTLNLDEAQIEAAITPRTRAIVVVHYGGVACDMTGIMQVAQKHGLPVIEDAAHALGAFYQERPLGSYGDLAIFSFHETKNVQCGEGGALLVNNPGFLDRADIIWEKGTNRKQFFAGQTDKYTWVDKGSSFLPSELQAAFLWAQMQSAEDITRQRLAVWNTYANKLQALQAESGLRLPVIPDDCRHNGHLFYVLLSSATERTRILQFLNDNGVNAVFHYVPLHQSPAGLRYGRQHGALPITTKTAERLLRLPLWVAMSGAEVMHVVSALNSALASIAHLPFEVELLDIK